MMATTVATEPANPTPVDRLDYFFLSLGELLTGDLRDDSLFRARIGRLHQIRRELGGLLEEGSGGAS